MKTNLQILMEKSPSEILQFIEDIDTTGIDGNFMLGIAQSSRVRSFPLDNANVVDLNWLEVADQAYKYLATKSSSFNKMARFQLNRLLIREQAIERLKDQISVVNAYIHDIISIIKNDLNFDKTEVKANALKIEQIINTHDLHNIQNELPSIEFLRIIKSYLKILDRVYSLNKSEPDRDIAEWLDVLKYLKNI